MKHKTMASVYGKKIASYDAVLDCMHDVDDIQEFWMDSYFQSPK